MSSEPSAVSNASAATGRFLQELDTLVRARYPLLYLVSWEEQRMDAILGSLAQNHGKQLYAWSITKGLRKLSGARVVPPFEGSEDPLVAMAAIEKLGEPSLVVLKDFHPLLSEPKIIRAVRELGQALQKTY